MESSDCHLHLRNEGPQTEVTRFSQDHTASSWQKNGIQSLPLFHLLTNNRQNGELRNQCAFTGVLGIAIWKAPRDQECALQRQRRLVYERGKREFTGLDLHEVWLVPAAHMLSCWNAPGGSQAMLQKSVCGLVAKACGCFPGCCLHGPEVRGPSG